MPVLEFIAAQAINLHKELSRNVKLTYPDLTTKENDETIIAVIDRLARMRGWTVKREYVAWEDD